jgi:hypothetical protein
MGELLHENSKMAAGFTRALQTPSQSVIRVVATLVPPATISWVRLPSAAERLYANLMYALADHNGEIHFPKDEILRELSVSPHYMTSLRQKLLEEMHQLADRNLPLSAEWWRQLGDQVMVDSVRSGGPARRAKMQRLANPSSSGHSQEAQAECILEERPTANAAGKWFKVRWANYHPSHEAWRKWGAVGTPIETWEPARNIKGTQVWLDWLAQADADAVMEEEDLDEEEPASSGGADEATLGEA